MPRSRKFSTAARLVGFRGLAMALILVQSIILARVFGAEAFGVFSFAVSVISIAALFVTLGLDQYIMRYAAKLGKDALRRDPIFPRVRRLIWTLVAPLVVVTSVSGVVVALLIGMENPYQVGLIAVFSTLALLIFRKFLESFALGLKKPNMSFIGSNIVYPAVMIIGALGILVVGGPLDSRSIGATYACALALSAGVVFFLLRPQIVGPWNRYDRRVPIDRREVVHASFHLTMISAGFIIGKNLDVVLTGILADPESVAAVRILARLGEAIAIFRVIALTYYKPFLAEAGMNGDKEGLRRHTRSMGSVYILTGIPIFLFLWVSAPWVLSLWGPDFPQYEWAFRIYMLGVFVMLVGGPASAALSMSGEERYASLALWISLAVGAALNVALIPPLGVLGCAYASLTSMIVLTVLSVSFAARRLQISTSGLSEILPTTRRLAQAIARRLKRRTEE